MPISFDAAEVGREHRYGSGWSVDRKQSSESGINRFSKSVEVEMMVVMVIGEVEGIKLSTCSPFVMDEGRGEERK